MQVSDQLASPQAVVELQQRNFKNEIVKVLYTVF
jgi:hypothetical protein